MYEGADGERNLDVLLPVAVCERLNEFVFELILQVEAAGVQYDIEVDAGVPEGMEADDRRGESDGFQFIIQGFGALLAVGRGIILGIVQRGFFLVKFYGYFLCHLQRDLFHELQIAVIGNADRDGDDDIVPRFAVVRGDGGGDGLVRNHDDIAVVGRGDRRIAPVDVRDAAFFSRAEADIVVDLQLFGDDELQPGENVCKGFLQTECQRHTADTHGRDDRCDGNAVILQDDEHADAVDHDLENVIQQGALGNCAVRTAQLPVHKPRQCAFQHAHDGEHDDREEDTGKNLCDGSRK